MMPSFPFILSFSKTILPMVAIVRRGLIRHSIWLALFALLAFAQSATADTFSYTGAVQTFTASQAGFYKITANGASGGTGDGIGTSAGGRGATASGTFFLSAGTVLQVAVGGAGSNGSQNGGGGHGGGGGGGGGSFVYINPSTPLMVAGGGGGGGAFNPALGADAVAATNGSNGLGTGGGAGGTNGSGGTGGQSASSNAGGGAGFTSDGGDGNSGGGRGGKHTAVFNGGAGATGANDFGGNGGFGGGGGGGIFGVAGGGGGGGYSGGGGAGSPTGGNGGGGGGSFVAASYAGTNVGDATKTSGTTSGNGSVTIVSGVNSATVAARVSNGQAREGEPFTVFVDISNYRDQNNNPIKPTSGNVVIKVGGMDVSQQGISQAQIDLGGFTVQAGTAVPDDSPTGTPSDVIPISATVTLDSLVTTATGSITITNAPPESVQITAPAHVLQGVPFNFSGTFTDVGALDTFVITIDWKDGTPNTVINRGAGQQNFSTSHTYAGQAGGQSTFNVSVTITDDDTGSVTATRTVIVDRPSLIVTTTVDEDNGSSDPGVGNGTSLREALAYAATLPASPEITFNIPANQKVNGVWTITLGSEISRTSGNGFTVTGPGADQLTVSGANATRLFSQSIAATQTCTFTGLTLARGFVNNANSTSQLGGAIYSTCALVLRDCVFSGNSTQSSTSNNSLGGAVYVSGGATIERCTFTGNSSLQSVNSSCEGGAIHAISLGGALLKISDSKFINNQIKTSGNSAFMRGGAISAIGCNLTVERCEFTSNSAVVSGAPADFASSFIEGGTLCFTASSQNLVASVTDCTFTGSQVNGATFCRGGTIGLNGFSAFTADLTRTRIAGGSMSISTTANVSSMIYNGGAVSCLGNSDNPGGSSLTLTDCQVTDHTLTASNGNNSVTAGGGGLFGQYATLKVVRSTISGNRVQGAITANNGSSAQVRGGAIYVLGASLTVLESTLAGNSVSAQTPVGTGFGQGQQGGRPEASGGGIAYELGATVIVTNSTIAANTATTAGLNFGSSDVCAGGGIFGSSFQAPQATLTNVTVTGNTTASTNGNGSAGGVASAGTFRLRQTLIAGNTTTGGTAPGPDATGTLTSDGYNLLGKSDGSTGIVNGQNGDQAGTIATPLDAKFDPNGLRDNGGPTKTAGLLATSPAVDAGDPSFNPGSFTPPLTADQRGTARVTKGKAASPAARVDIGAYELIGVPTFATGALSIANGNGTLDLAALTGATPGGGTFSGQGVTNGIFSAAGLPIGVYTIIYTISDGHGGTNSATIIVTVAEPPSLIVNTTADPGSPTDLKTSLREALAYAATLPQTPAPEVTFNIPTSDPGYNASTGAWTIKLGGTALDVSGSVTITGPGADKLIISGNQASRVFSMDHNQSTFDVSMSELTIANGKIVASGFGNIVFGGAIYAYYKGKLTLDQCVVRDNALVNDAGQQCLGGAIYRGLGPLTLTNCTLSGNSTSTGNGYGGAIYIFGNLLTLDHCVLSGNQAKGSGGVGGAVYASSQVAATATTFANNVADCSAGFDTAQGGAMLIYGSGVTTLDGCIFSGNSIVSDSEAFGGALNVGNGTVRISGCTFTGNGASDKSTFSSYATGGAMFLGGGFDGTAVTIEDSVIAGNQASAANYVHGGGISVGYGATLTMERSSVTGNQITAVTGSQSSYAYGAGLDLAGNAVSLFQCTIGNNTASAAVTVFGGAIYVNSSTLGLTNCTISGNAAQNSGSGYGTHTQGGGIYQFSTPVTLANTIVSGNSATGGQTAEGPDVWGTFVSQGHNLVGQTDNLGTGFTNGTNGDQTGTTASPLDAKLGQLQNNGGPTSTFALLGGSPALDNGSDALAVDASSQPLTVDQRGQPRRLGTVDIGAVEAAPARLYVDQNVSGGAGSGFSWADALPELRAANVVALGNPTVLEIWVAKGTYKPAVANGGHTATFQLRSGLAIYGGFTSGQTQVSQRDANPAINGTVLSGDLNGDDGANFANNGENSDHVVTGSGTDATAVLNGFTVTAGNAKGDRGGGVYISDGSPTLGNIIVSGNAATLGGGIYTYAGNSMLTNVTFSGNSAATLGGGLFNSYSDPSLTNVIFVGNSAGNSGGAISSTNSLPTLTNATFSGNSAPLGGAMYGFDCISTIRNCIFWDDQGYEIIVGGGEAYVSNSIVQGSGGSTNWKGTFGVDGGGNLDADPLFVTPITAPPPTTAGNLRLRSTSPALNRGNNNVTSPALPTTDLDGAARITAGSVDMGAYELIAPPTLTNNALAVANGGTLTDLATLTGATPGSGTFSGAGVSFVNGKWVFDSTGLAIGTQVTVTYTIAGPNGTSNQVTLTITVAETPGLVVTTADDSAPGTATDTDKLTSLREALAYAATLSGPQTVTFSNTTANGAVNFSDGAVHPITVLATALEVGGEVTIAGPGVNVLTLTGADAARVLRVLSGAVATVQDLAIEHGVGVKDLNNGYSGGGGIRNDGTLSVLRCRVADHAADLGAGIYNLGTLRVDRSALPDNLGPLGGAAIFSNGSLTVTRSAFSHNRATSGEGGAVLAISSGVMAFTDCTFLENEGHFAAGAIRCLASLTIISRSTFAGNHSAFYGGAIKVDGPLNLSNDTFIDNQAPSLGGAIACTVPDPITATHCTFRGNAGAGSSPTLHGGRLTLVNCIFASSPNEQQIQSPVSIAGRNNFFQATMSSSAGGLLDGVDGNRLGVDPRLATALADNGGPTQTLSLLPDSPAIDAGADLATLSAGVADASTQTIPVNEVSFFPDGAGVAIQIESEQMIVTAADTDTNTLTVTRGANNTAATPHASGAAVNYAFDQRGSGFARATKGNPGSAAARIDIGAYELFAAPTFAASNVNVLAGSSGNDLAAASGAAPAGGTFSGSAQVTSDGHFDATGLAVNMQVTIIYTISDGYGATNSATFTVTVVALPAKNDTAYTNGRKPIDIDVLANDPGATGSVTLSILAGPQHGTATIVNGKIHYVPTGPLPLAGDTFTYTYVDGHGGTGTASVTIINFAAIAGNYDGLIDDPTAAEGAEAHQRAGHLRLVVGRTGRFTGVLTFAGIKLSPVLRQGFSGYAISSQLNVEGGGLRMVLRHNGAPLNLALRFDVPSRQVIGTVESSDAAGAPFTSEFILAARTAAGPLAGIYRLDLPANTAPLPTGTGEALVRITKAGDVRTNGRLGDGLHFSCATLFHADESFPIYTGLYPGNLPRRGSLRGTVQFPQMRTSGDALGALDWFKPARPNDRQYPAGFDTTCNAALSR